MTHSSGLESYLELSGFDTFYKTPHSSEQLIEFLSSTSLRFKPGTQFEYSGSGYNLLGLVIERASGMGYSEYLSQEIFIPLGMKASVVSQEGMLSQMESKLPQLARGYIVQQDGKKTLAGEVNLSTAFAEGSLISTILDLHIWTEALFSCKIFSAQMVEKMTHPYFRTQREGMWIGYGLFIDRTNRDHPVYYHSGLINGYESFWCFDPDQSINVIVLSNEVGGNTYDTAELLFQETRQLASKR